jgi:hypothetical protein
VKKGKFMDRSIIANSKFFSRVARFFEIFFEYAGDYFSGNKWGNKSCAKEK